MDCVQTDSIQPDIVKAHDVARYYQLKSAGFSTRRGVVRAVDGVSLSVSTGEVFGLVGESGCGKSSLGRLLLRHEPVTRGRIWFEGADISRFSAARLKKLRRQAQIIYQDPYSALNPRQKVGRIIAEPLEIHGIAGGAENRARVDWLMEKVGLRPGQAERYPHEFSGGQRQRIVIARALALNPKLLIADEPVSALDVSVQAQVINLLKQLRAEFNLTYIFISHDLSVVAYLCDRVAVMYLGRIVETGPKTEFYDQPLHPYAQALLSAAPRPDPFSKNTRTLLAGDVPSPIHPPNGCAFHPRCPQCRDHCRQHPPPLEQKSPNRWVACWEV